MKLNRSHRPKDQIASSFHLPKINTSKIKNGLDVYLIENNRLPIIKLNLVIPAGSRFDAFGNEGLAYLTSLCLDEGAGNYDSLQLANEIDKLGSSIELSTSVDHIFIKLTSLKEHFERTLELFSLIVKEPLFDEENFQREKIKQITKISQSFDDPGYMAANAYQKNVFKDTGYATPVVGYTNSVEHMQSTSLKDFYNKFFHSSNSNIMSVGSISSDQLSELLNKYLGDFHFNKQAKDSAPQFKKSEPTIFFINKENATQSEIVVGHLVKERNDEDFFAAKLANSILGGQFTSRINLNLREDKGYTYGAHSSINYNKYSGYFSLATSVQSDFTKASLKEIIKEIDFIRKDVRKDEIEFAKSSLVKQFPSMFETYSQLLQRLNSKVIFELDNDYYDDYLQNIWDVTKSEIFSASQSYFKPDELSCVIVGNKETIAEDLKSFEGFNFVELDKFGNKI